jgi:hypothetical protein
MLHKSTTDDVTMAEPSNWPLFGEENNPLLSLSAVYWAHAILYSTLLSSSFNHSHSNKPLLI